MKHIYPLLIACISVFYSSQLNGQTTLAAGDIVIVGYNSDDNNINVPGNAYVDDDICFLLLKDIAANTDIYFTDLGWTGSGFQQNANNGCASGTGAANDGCIRWRASTALSAGTQVRIGCHFGLVATSGTVTGILQSPAGGVGGPGGSSPSYVSLATSSDEIFAFQGSMAAPTLIAAVHYGNAWTGSVTTCQFTSINSVNPGASVGGYSFLNSTAVPSENGRYNGSMTGDIATIRSSVLNVSNWVFNDASQYALPIAGGFSVLPVHLISFDGKRTPSGNYLQWAVENEERFSHYDVEGSTDARTFSLLGRVNAMGLNQYSFNAATSSKDQLYRLKMVDLDGGFSYSKVLRMQGDASKQKLVIFPNPARDVINISTSEPIIDFTISDANGRRRLQQNGNGMQTAKLDMKALSAGIYVITITTTGGKLTQRIVKDKN